MKESIERALFAAGCFWGVESAFRKIEGVVDVTVGYAGGNFENPTYEDVCSGTTGHAEVVQVEYDPEVVNYNSLLKAFWSMHNPTTPDRQGVDRGSQYRSMILYVTPEQKDAALQSISEQAEKYNDPIVTQIVSATRFYPAEEYHQRYLEKKKRV